MFAVSCIEESDSSNVEDNESLPSLGETIDDGSPGSPLLLPQQPEITSPGQSAINISSDCAGVDTSGLSSADTSPGQSVILISSDCTGVDTSPGQSAILISSDCTGEGVSDSEQVSGFSAREQKFLREACALGRCLGEGNLSVQEEGELLCIADKYLESPPRLSLLQRAITFTSPRALAAIEASFIFSPVLGREAGSGEERGE